MNTGPEDIKLTQQELKMADEILRGFSHLKLNAGTILAITGTVMLTVIKDTFEDIEGQVNMVNSLYEDLLRGIKRGECH